MTHLEPHKLWIGHAGDGRDFRAILDSGIQAVVCLAMEETMPQLPRELLSCRFPLLDGVGNNPGLIKLAIQTTVCLMRDHIPILLCCGAGMSRSPAIAAASLSIALNRSPESTLTDIRRVTPCDVSPGLWTEVVAALNSLQS